MPPKRKADAPVVVAQRSVAQLRSAHQEEWKKYGRNAYIAISNKGKVLDSHLDVDELVKRCSGKPEVWYVMPANPTHLQSGKDGNVAVDTGRKPIPGYDASIYAYEDAHIRTSFVNCNITAVGCSFEAPLRGCDITATACTFAHLDSCVMQGGGNRIGLANNCEISGDHNRVECLYRSTMEGKGGVVITNLFSLLEPKDTFVDTTFMNVLYGAAPKKLN